MFIQKYFKTAVLAGIIFCGQSCTLLLIDHCAEDCVRIARDEGGEVISTRRACLTSAGFSLFTLKLQLVKPDSGEKYFKLRTSYSGYENIKYDTVRLWSGRTELRFRVQDKTSTIIEDASEFQKRLESGTVLIKDGIPGIMELAKAETIMCEFAGESKVKFKLSDDAAAGFREIVSMYK